MINQLNRLDQVSNNLANVNTNGFKQEGTTETPVNSVSRALQFPVKNAINESAKKKISAID
jgi:flagellar basal-body rod protein FlgG